MLMFSLHLCINLLCTVLQYVTVTHDNQCFLKNKIYYIFSRFTAQCQVTFAMLTILTKLLSAGAVLLTNQLPLPSQGEWAGVVDQHHHAPVHSVTSMATWRHMSGKLPMKEENIHLKEKPSWGKMNMRKVLKQTAGQNKFISTCIEDRRSNTVYWTWPFYRPAKSSRDIMICTQSLDNIRKLFHVALPKLLQLGHIHAVVRKI